MVSMGDGETCPGRNGLIRYINKYISVVLKICVHGLRIKKSFTFFYIFRNKNTINYTLNHICATLLISDGITSFRLVLEERV